MTIQPCRPCRGSLRAEDSSNGERPPEPAGRRRGHGGAGVSGCPQCGSGNRLAQLLGRGGWSGWGGVPVDTLAGLSQRVPRGRAQVPDWRFWCRCNGRPQASCFREEPAGGAAAPLSAPVPARLEGAAPGLSPGRAVHAPRWGPLAFLHPSTPGPTSLILPTEPCS